MNGNKNREKEKQKIKNDVEKQMPSVCEIKQDAHRIQNKKCKFLFNGKIVIINSIEPKK